MPGETIPTLRQELLDRQGEIDLDRNKMYCFDSEPFQFLACVQADIKFPEEDFEVFSAGWSRAVREQDRMLEHISSLKPRLSLNNIRSRMFPMTRSLTEMIAAMQNQIRKAEETQVKAKLVESEASELEREMQSLCLKIQEKKDAKRKMEATVDQLNNIIGEFEIEQEEVLRVAATFGFFLKDLSMFPCNDDDLGNFLDKAIQQECEKKPELRDEDLIKRLKKSKMFYDEEKAVIELAVKEFGNMTGFTPEQVEEVQEDLFKMKHFGKSLFTTFSKVNSGSETNWEQKKLVYNGRGFKSKEVCVNPGKAVEVRRVRMARGQQEHEEPRGEANGQHEQEEPRGEANGQHVQEEPRGEDKKAKENRERTERCERREKMRATSQLWRFDNEESDDEEDILTVV